MKHRESPAGQSFLCRSIPAADRFSDERLILSTVGVMLRQNFDQFLRGGVPPVAALADGREPLHINALAIPRRSLLLAARSRRGNTCGFIDIEAGCEAGGDVSSASPPEVAIPYARPYQQIRNPPQERRNAAKP